MERDSLALPILCIQMVVLTESWKKRYLIAYGTIEEKGRQDLKTAKLSSECNLKSF